MTARARQEEAARANDEATAPASRRIADALARFCRADGNDWGVGLHAEPLREVQRPFSRLQWYRLQGPGVSSTVVVKAARGTSAAVRKTASAEAMAGRRLEAVFAGQSDLGVIAPLRTYPDLLAVVTPAISAPSLATAIEERAGWWPSSDTLRDLERGCELAGRWLRHLHRECPAPAAWTTDTLRDDLELRVRLLREFPITYGMPTRLARRIERWLDERLPRGARADLACSETHRDFSPSNMLYDGRRLQVLDFGTLRAAPRLLDATRFLHQVDLLRIKPRYRKATRRALQQAFVSGYDDAALSDSALVPVFMVRHELSHWLGAARRVAPGLRQSSLVVCWHHRSVLARIDHHP